jgi:hypothetical protein
MWEDIIVHLLDLVLGETGNFTLAGVRALHGSEVVT